MYNKIEKQNKAGSFCNVATIRDADGEMQWVEENINDITVRQENSYQGWQCYAGLESLMINWDGEVHRATCRVGGSLGNIYNNTFEPPSEAIICTRKFCTCVADIPLTKEIKDENIICNS